MIYLASILHLSNCLVPCLSSSLHTYSSNITSSCHQIFFVHLSSCCRFPLLTWLVKLSSNSYELTLLTFLCCLEDPSLSQLADPNEDGNNYEGMHLPLVSSTSYCVLSQSKLLSHKHHISKSLQNLLIHYFTKFTLSHQYCHSFLHSLLWPSCWIQKLYFHSLKLIIIIVFVLPPSIAKHTEQYVF